MKCYAAIILALSDYSLAFQSLSASSTTRTAKQSEVFRSFSSLQDCAAFSHAPIDYFNVDKLEPKGPRKNADIGRPHDSTRWLVDLGATAAGSWWCKEGGWPSPSLRDTTEIFLVLSGRGCLTDLDDTKHYFGPGDTVILPKGWSGRWDVIEDIHKIWVVHEHPNVEETSTPIRAVITPYNELMLSPPCDDKMSIAAQTIYKKPSTEVGSWTCTPGSFPVDNLQETVFFHVLEGVFFLTNEDGSARRCVPGDTIVLPKGWTGKWDIIQTLRKLWVRVN